MHENLECSARKDKSARGIILVSTIYFALRYYNASESLQYIRMVVLRAIWDYTKRSHFISLYK